MDFVLGTFPPEIQDFLQKQAEEAGESTSDYVVGQYNTLGSQAFITETVDDFTNLTMGEFCWSSYMANCC